jgi:hypothetical protein
MKKSQKNRSKDEMIKALFYLVIDLIGDKTITKEQSDLVNRFIIDYILDEQV